MNDPGSPYDSHPPPGRASTGSAGCPSTPARSRPTPTQPAWSLFANRDALEGEMTALANRRLAAAGAFANAPQPMPPPTSAPMPG